MLPCNGVDRAKDTRERRLTRGTMDGLRKADDGLSSGILFSSTVGVATQQVVLCLDWCTSTGQPESTPSNARTRPVMSSTGKRSAVKVACCVWAGGKGASSYLSVQKGQQWYLASGLLHSTTPCRQGVRHFLPLPIKTENIGARFERNLWLAVSVLMGNIGFCQRPW
jgi:hypothetical protein